MPTPKQPTCPACGSDDLRHEADDRHQCRKCLWRCRIKADGSTEDWLNLGRNRAALQPKRFDSSNLRGCKS